MKFILIATALLFSHVSAKAEKWISLGTHPEGTMTFYYDADSIKAVDRSVGIMLDSKEFIRRPKELLSIVFLVDLKKPDKTFSNLPYRSEKRIYLADCQRNLVSGSSSSQFMAGNMGVGREVDRAPEGDLLNMYSPSVLGKNNYPVKLLALACARK